jgi:hypothetical protein
MSRVGDRHGYISKQKGQNEKFRKKKKSGDHAGRSWVGDRHGSSSKRVGQNAEF